MMISKKTWISRKNVGEFLKYIILTKKSLNAIFVTMEGIGRQ